MYYSARATIPGASRSKAWNVFALSEAGIGGSNSAQDVGACLCVGSGLATSRYPAQGVLPTEVKKSVSRLPVHQTGATGIKTEDRGPVKKNPFRNFRNCLCCKW